MLPLAGATGLLILGVGIFLLGYLADPRVSERNFAVVRDSEGVALLSLAGKPIPLLSRVYPPLHRSEFCKSEAGGHSVAGQAEKKAGHQANRLKRWCLPHEVDRRSRVLRCGHPFSWSGG